ncbi:MAG: hypothetical protein OEM82_07420, partial [Acidobacteriota bacterium]|nr:hypothetical protein [Acidobacteriota bacterium]
PPLVGSAVIERLNKENRHLEDFGGRCEPAFANLRYCYGIVSISRDKTAPVRGNYLQIHKFRSGKWEIVIDLFSALPVAPTEADNPVRLVTDNVISSNGLPKIRIRVDKDFEYLGRFDFQIRDVAAGERFVFVDATNKKVNRLFIAQFERFLPHIDDHYRYSFENALSFGVHKFRQNNYAYSNLEARQTNPNGEGVLTEDFLKRKGFELEDELMMSRFITVPRENRKHELILYYLENVSSSKHRLSEFYEDDQATEIWKAVGKGLKERSLSAFEIR